MLEIDDRKYQLQLSCLLWELLGGTVAIIITITITTIIIGNIYMIINMLDTVTRTLYLSI